MGLPSVLHKTVGKRELKGTISWVMEKHGPERTKELLDDLKKLGFSWATRAGISLGVYDVATPKAKMPLCEGTKHRTLEAEARYEKGDITVVEKFLKVTDEWTKASEQVKNEAMRNFEENAPTNPVYMMSSSGARGNVSQVRQLLAMRGLMADATGQLIDVPITKNLSEGMTAVDMMISSHGARKGVIDTALRTADSGYLYRRLDFVGSPVVVRGPDCGTDEGIDLYLHGSHTPTPALHDRLRGRVLAEDLKDPRTGETMFLRNHLITGADAALVSKTWKEAEKKVQELPPIRIRSPLTCKLPNGVCAKCYGEDLSTPGVLAKQGTPVGTIAAQSMGEPGTQLTMRTFHTGGAFEGGAFEGVQAATGGSVHLHDEDGNAITKASVVAGEWARNLHGDAHCLLKCKAILKLQSTEGDVVQKEEVPPGALVNVQDGQVVSYGQVLFSKPMTQKSTNKTEEVAKIPKPIIADEGGEVVIKELTTSEGNQDLSPSGSRLIWVLQGTCNSFDHEENCTSLVQHGDIVDAGVPLAAEWVTSDRPGVVRFVPAKPVAASQSGAWRWLEPKSAASGEKEEAPADGAEGDPVVLDRSMGVVSEEAVQQRADFDWLSFEGQAAEYYGSYHVPPELIPDENGVDSRILWKRPGQASPTPKASSEVPEAKRFSRNVVVHTCASNDQHIHEASLPKLSVFCDAPSQRQPRVVRPVRRIVHPEHVVPLGGLVFSVPNKAPEGPESLLWCAEEVHSLQMAPRLLPQLLDAHGRWLGADSELFVNLPYDETKTLLTTRVEGCICIYKSVPGQKGRAPTLIREGDGIYRRECKERIHAKEVDVVVGSNQDARSIEVECTIKTGYALWLPSDLFDKTWYSPTDGGAVHLHQKLVKPGVAPLAAFPEMKYEKMWVVMELLGNPAERPAVQLLVRPARKVDVPATKELPMPTGGNSIRSWHARYTSGEVVESLDPVALVYELESSLSRHPSEGHCTSTALVGEGTSTKRWSGATKEVPSAAVTNGGVELARTYPDGKVFVIQHSELGPPLQQSGRRAWQDSVPQFHAPVHLAAAVRVPRRQLSSPDVGIVRQLETGAADAQSITLVLLSPQDFLRVPCRAKPAVAVGSLVQQGAMLNPDSPDDVCPRSGQVVLVEECASGEHPFVLTIRKGRAYLVTGEGRVDVKSGTAVEKGDKLGTEDLVVPRTSDIVQGLPRITRLFEATHGELQLKLDNMAGGALGLAGALKVRQLFQQDLVSELQSVYLEQGVYINMKHIELIVKRMTSQCEVVTAASTGLNKGVVVDYDELESIQALQPHSEIRVRPRVHGITRAGKESHILVSMGFREVDNMLVQEVMNGPSLHPVAGVKENLMMGKPINVGTNSNGNLSNKRSSESAQLSKIRLDKIPEQASL